SSRLEESAQLTQPESTLTTLRHQEKSLGGMIDTLDDWNGELKRREQQIDRQITQLGKLEQSWNLTLAGARGQETPPQVLETITNTLEAVRQSRKAVRDRRIRISTLQNRVEE